MRVVQNDYVCAVILTYQPELAEVTRLIDWIGRQVGGVIVVDNGSIASCREALAKFVAAQSGVEWLPLGRNLGVAAGHNIGIGRAIERGFRFTLILDQDSLPAPDMVVKLVDGYQALVVRGERVASVGPRYLEYNSGRESYFVRFGFFGFRKVWCGGDSRGAIRANFLISSGALLLNEAFQKVGSMREDFFIDHVDTEWFLRAGRNDWKVYGICGARMEHKLGGQRLRVWVGRWREIPLHTPLRYYYMSRNSIYMYTNWQYPLRWKIGHSWRLAGMFAAIVVFCPGRFSHMQMMLIGAWHGLCGRLGRYHAD